MNTTQATDANNSSEMLKNSGWLCGFRVNNMDGPQNLTLQVASHIDGAMSLIEETNDILTEVITTYNKRESNYAQHGWSAGAMATISPWTSSRIYMTNRHNPGGTWITRRILAQRLRVRVFLEDLAPTPEFEAAIAEALNLSTKFEKLQAVYRALDRWGDVVPLEIDMGYSLSFTDTEGNFSLPPAAASTDSPTNLSTIKTANIIRKGAISDIGWDEATWAGKYVPAIEWRPVRINAVVPTINLLTNDIQARLADLHNERITYIPPLTIDPINWPCKIYDGTNDASRTISKVVVRSGNEIVSISVTYLDGVTSHDGGNSGGNEQTFTLTEGEHIVETLTCADNEWLHAIQFITNKGRCSAIYGKLQGTPVVSKSEGGVLAGFSISTREKSAGAHLVTGVIGIWRHDIIPRAPKGSDVYSEYIGGKNQHGNGFNDRALIGNSSSIYITCVEIRAQDDIHSIEFTYTDVRDAKNRKFKAPRHGGSHGPYHRFDLERGEHIVSITGKYSDHWLTQLCFGTNLGRASDVYGGGVGQSFSVRAPLGENGRSMRLQYTIGRCEAGLNGVIFVWTPGLP